MSSLSINTSSPLQPTPEGPVSPNSSSQANGFGSSNGLTASTSFGSYNPPIQAMGSPRNSSYRGNTGSIPLMRDGSFSAAGPVSPLGGGFKARGSVVVTSSSGGTSSAGGSRGSVNLPSSSGSRTTNTFVMPVASESKFSDDDIQARVQANLLHSSKKDLSKLFGADMDREQIKQVIKIDKNAELRKVVTIRGYRIPNKSLENLENMELTELYHQHCDMPDVFKRRFSEDERAEIQEQKKKEDEENRAKRKEKEFNTLPYRLHFLLDIKQVMMSVQEPTEMYVAIYNSKENKFITEEYCLQLTESGSPAIGVVSCKCIFVNLSQDDISANLKLVLKIYRTGDLVPKKDKKEIKKKMSIVSGTSTATSVVDSSNEVFRRPWGASVIDLGDKTLADIMKNLGKEIPSSRCPIYLCTNEKDYSSLHESIINKDAQLEESKSSIGIAYGLSGFACDLKDLEVKMPEYKTTAAIPKQELTGVDVTAKAKRNLLYLILQSGEFAQGIKKSAKNILVRITLRRNDDLSPVTNCISRGKGPMSRFITTWDSTVHYHLNNPAWNERLCIQLPEDEGIMDKYHLFFDVSHVSTSTSKKGIEPFSYCFLPLTEAAKATIIKDGVYKPTIFKYAAKDGKLEKGERFNDNEYLKFDTVTKEKRTTKEKLAVAIQLSTTSMSQDLDFHRILNYNFFSPEELYASLVNIPRKTGSEMIHILPALFDHLFGMLQDKRLNQTESNVFKSAQAAVIHLFIYCPKDRSLNIMLLDYFQNMFKQPQLHHILIGYFHILIKWVTSESAAKISEDMVLGELNYRVLINIMQGMKVLMQFVLKSFEQDLAQSQPSMSLQNVSMQMNNTIVAFNTLCQLESPSWIATVQKQWLQHFHLLYNALNVKTSPIPTVPVFNEIDIVNYTVTFFEICNKSNTELNIMKLQLLRQYIKDGKLKEPDWTIKFVATIITQFHFHIQKYQNINERVLSVLLMLDLVPTLILALDENNTTMDPNTKQTFIKIVDQVALFLPQLFEFCGELLYSKSNNTYTTLYESKLIPELKNIDIIRDTTVVILCLSLTNLMDEPRFEYLLSTLTAQSKEIERAFLLCAYHVVSKLIHNSAFPKFWLLLRLKEIQLGVRLIEWTSSRLCELYLIGDHFDGSIWKAFFQLSTTCLLADELNVENCEPEKRSYITSRFPDLRSTISAQLQLVWGFLQARQVELIDVMVGPLIELTQNANEEVVSMARSMFFNLLQREFDIKQNFQSVQYHTIDTVAKVIHDFGSGKLKGRVALDNYIKFFTHDLNETLQSHPHLLPAGTTFLGDINELFEHIVALESLPKHKKYEDERTSACINLIHYLKESGKKDIYEKYLMYLCELHNELNNYVEKANALLLHQQLLNWTKKPLEALESLPAQTESERKILLCEKAILAFDTAQCWERSIEVTQELAYSFEKTLFDFPAAAKILQQQSKHFELISQTDRIFPAFYRVAYFGSGFGADLRNQEFVFKSGNGLYPEGVREFTDRVKDKFPDATVQNTTDPPPENVLQDMKDWPSESPKENGMQYIQITTLTSSSEEEINKQPNRFEGTDYFPPGRVVKYLNNNNLRVFSYTRVSKQHLEQAKEKERLTRSASVTANNVPSPTTPTSGNSLTSQPTSGSLKIKEKEEKNEFRDLWLIKTFLITSVSIPSLQRRVFVVDKREVLMCPIENAVTAIHSKNLELRDLIDQVRMSNEEKPKQMGPLSMLLTGVVDAAVAGGVEKYREAFFSGDYLHNNPDHGPFVQQFKKVLSEQLIILKLGLEVFEAKCDRSLKPLSEHLSKTYTKMVTDLKQLLQQ